MAGGQSSRTPRPAPARRPHAYVTPDATSPTALGQRSTPVDRRYNYFAGAENPKDWNPCRNRLELFEGCILVDGDVRPCAWRTHQVRLHHGRPLLDRELFEPHVLGATVAQAR